jgi:hypothetical protein
MGLDQHANLRGEQIDWAKYYSDDMMIKRIIFLSGENTQDFSSSWRRSGQNKTLLKT